MPAIVTALELIARSMRLINALAGGEQPTSADANDGLETLNELIDGWSTQSMAVYGEDNDEFQTVAGVQMYTTGPGGTSGIITRPVYITDAYCVRQGITTYIHVVDQIAFNTIPLKNIQQPLVERMLYINDFPLGQIVLWPVPSEVVTIGLTTTRVLANITSLQQVIALPPGYLRALRYNLAVDLWPEYSNKITDIGQIRDTARKAFGHIKIANTVDTEMDFSSVPSVETGRSWDWRTSV
jgi:hypothetical protein